jgi:hypothetical protein
MVPGSDDLGILFAKKILTNFKFLFGQFLSLGQLAEMGMDHGQVSEGDGQLADSSAKKEKGQEHARNIIITTGKIYFLYSSF